MKKPVQMSFLFLALARSLSCDSSQPGSESKPPPATERQSLFDVPALVGKNIDDVRRSLGNPSDKMREPPDASYSEWDNRFHKQGYTLLVTFNPKTREVVDFFLPTREPSGKTPDYRDLLTVTNSRVTAQNYYVTPVPIREYPGEYSGIKIVKK